MTQTETAHEDGWRRVARSLWAWPAAILIGFPLGGLLADIIVDGVDSAGAALAGGLIAGAVTGAAEWYALRRWVSWLWIAATSVGFAVSLTAGAALVDYGIDRGDLIVMGAVTGIGVGALQALVLARHHIPGAIWWVLASPVVWALGWLISSYIISANIEERFTNFGAGGALVFALLTWLLLARLLERAEPAAARSI